MERQTFLMGILDFINLVQEKYQGILIHLLNYLNLKTDSKIVLEK